MANRIFIAQPDLSIKEEQYLLEAFRSSWISSTGSFIDRFEQEFAEICHVQTALASCNGTAALHLTMLGLGVCPGDEVLVPSLTYVATANAVRYVGATPIFVDVDPNTWCIDPARLEEAVTPRTRGIIPVHVYGHPADMDAINAVAARYGLWVVEDAAEAHFARYKGRRVGGLGDAAAFSFYGNKIITSGEGGAVTVNNQELGNKIRSLRQQSMDPNRRYYFPAIGYNYRMTNLACAILCAQIERYPELAEGRMRVYRSYQERLEGVPGISFQPVAEWAEITPWLFSIMIDAQAYGGDRDALMAFLSENGVETRPFFIPLHEMPPYADPALRRGGPLPVTERVSRSGMNLPTYPSLPEEHIDQICALIRSNARS